MHADFQDIYQRLIGLYEANIQSDNITGGVIGIFAKMSVDAILRGKLFEKGADLIHSADETTTYPRTSIVQGS